MARACSGSRRSRRCSQHPQRVHPAFRRREGLRKLAVGYGLLATARAQRFERFPYLWVDSPMSYNMPVEPFQVRTLELLIAARNAHLNIPIEDLYGDIAVRETTAPTQTRDGSPSQPVRTQPRGRERRTAGSLG